MASWSLITALSGYSFDLGAGLLGFAPRIWPEDFACFWSADGCWGQYMQRLEPAARVELRVDWGRVTLRGLNLGALGSRRLSRARLGEKERAIRVAEVDGVLQVRWDEPLTIETGETLVLQ